jgi:hypothetical protein
MIILKKKKSTFDTFVDNFYIGARDFLNEPWIICPRYALNSPFFLRAVASAWSASCKHQQRVPHTIANL